MRMPFHAALAFLIVARHVADKFRRSANGANGCQRRPLGNLERLSPHGYTIYKAMTDKKQFLTWLTCDDVQLGLATSVHESVHVLTQERDAFPLIDGGDVRRPHQVSKFFSAERDCGEFRFKGFLRADLSPPWRSVLGK